MKIMEVSQVNDEIAAAFERLMPQLAPEAASTREELEQIVESPAAVVFVARDSDRRGEIVGTLTLVHYRVPSGLRAWIEDVVVDESARGKGVGAALCRAGIERAREIGAESVNLTSNPSRESANRLYQRLGFVRRDTNNYRLALTPKQNQ